MHALGSRDSTPQPAQSGSHSPGQSQQTSGAHNMSQALPAHMDADTVRRVLAAAQEQQKFVMQGYRLQQQASVTGSGYGVDAGGVVTALASEPAAQPAALHQPLEPLSAAQPAPTYIAPPQPAASHVWGSAEATHSHPAQWAVMAVQQQAEPRVQPLPLLHGSAGSSQQQDAQAAHMTYHGFMSHGSIPRAS
jgi:hypothetical protein